MYEEYPIMDRRHALMACSGYEDILQEVTEAFLMEAPNFYEKMQLADSSNDRAGLEISAHGLKSAARSVGALRLGEICYAIELAMKASDWEAARAALPEAEGIFRETMDWFARGGEK